jgi:XTP/dITP diphosphohydrolase
MEDVEERNATFHAVVAFHRPDSGSPKCFHGKVLGKIASQMRGAQGFGFDPIFVPKANKGQTFAEMSRQQKNKYSHRAEALRKFAEWYISRQNL